MPFAATYVSSNRFPPLQCVMKNSQERSILWADASGKRIHFKPMWKFMKHVMLARRIIMKHVLDVLLRVAFTRDLRVMIVILFIFLLPCSSTERWYLLLSFNLYCLLRRYGKEHIFLFLCDR